MRRFGNLAVVLLTGTFLAGCVYYNGVYNARRLARSAEKAEREGRTFDANGYWGQVAVKAESVIVRHPTSKWVEDALVLRGQALARMGRCPEALVPLRRVVSGIADSAKAERANFAYGQCQLAVGEPQLAVGALARVIDSRDRFRRREARLLYARALRLAGRPVEAVPILAELGPSAVGDRLVTLADAGDQDAAFALADSLIAQRDSAAPWDSTLAAMGRREPAAASQLLDRLAAAQLNTGSQRRWAYEDAQRLAHTDPAAARARLAEAKVLGDPQFVGPAQTILLELEIRGAGSVARLSAIADSLGQAPATSEDPREDQGVEDLVGRELRTALTAVHLADTTTAGSAQGDLRLFLAAELARDRLHAPAAATELLWRLVNGWPDSPYAPKALLAVSALDPAAAESTRVQLEERYGGSPYLAALRGEEAPGYRSLEDSLGAFAATFNQPTTVLAPDDDRLLRRRRQPGRRTRADTLDAPSRRRDAERVGQDPVP